MEEILLCYSDLIASDVFIRRSIFYTGQIGTIVPHSNVPEELKWLYDNGQYVPISVFNGVDTMHPEYPVFVNAFIDAISSPEFIVHQGRVHNRMSVNLQHYNLYLRKLTPEIREFLLDRKLITDESGEKSTIDIAAGVTYLAMLADYFAKIEQKKGNLLIPATDDPELETIVYKTGRETVAAFNLILNHCLPMPHESVSLKKVVAFKIKHQDDLLRFRQRIKEMELKLYTCPPEHVAEQVMSFERELKRDIAELRNAMQKSLIETFLGGLSSLTGNQGLSQIFDYITKETIDQSTFITIGTGLYSIGKTIISGVHKRNEILNNSNLAYLLLGEKKGILEKHK